MDAWVRDYAEQHPRAAYWARGSRTIVHTEQTQARIFRMAEQLRTSFDWATAEPLFTVLTALDRGVDEEQPATPLAAAHGAALTYSMLFGKRPELDHRGWPRGFGEVGEDQIAEMTSRLQAGGFDPIVIDGRDPAAYLWAWFEMQQRQAACAEVVRLRQHRPQHPRCLAIVPATAEDRQPVALGSSRG